jgi:uroporphyrinogen-III synthase
MTGAVLILRPAGGADRTAAAARASGLRPLRYPLFAVEPVDWDAPDAASFDAVLLTSANAARSGGPALARYAALPVHAVGATSAAAARAAGFTDVREGGGDIAGTLPLIAAAGHRRLLHLAGEDVRPFDAGALMIERRILYRAAPSGDAAGLAAALEDAAVVLVHSPRAGERLASLTAAPQRQARALAAISPAALEASGQGWAVAAAAVTPGDAALLALAGKLCDDPAMASTPAAPRPRA